MVTFYQFVTMFVTKYTEEFVVDYNNVNQS